MITRFLHSTIGAAVHAVAPSTSFGAHRVAGPAAVRSTLHVSGIAAPRIWLFVIFLAAAVCGAVGSAGAGTEAVKFPAPLLEDLRVLTDRTTLESEVVLPGEAGEAAKAPADGGSSIYNAPLARAVRTTLEKALFEALHEGLKETPHSTTDAKHGGTPAAPDSRSEAMPPGNNAAPDSRSKVARPATAALLSLLAPLATDPELIQSGSIPDSTDARSPVFISLLQREAALAFEQKLAETHGFGTDPYKRWMNVEGKNHRLAIALYDLLFLEVDDFPAQSITGYLQKWAKAGALENGEIALRYLNFFSDERRPTTREDALDPRP